MPWTSKSAKGHHQEGEFGDTAKAVEGCRELDAEVWEVGGLGHQGG
jgi:hypothetical protein